MIIPRREVRDNKAVKKMEDKKSIYADVRASAISWRVRDMYNLYGTIRRVLFEGRKAERAAMLSELIKMQGGNIGGSAKVETLDDRLKLARELENIDDGEEVVLFKDKSGKLVWVRLNGEKWL